MRPRVLLDCDGVIADFLTPFLHYVNHFGRTSHTLSEMSKWDLYESFSVPQDIRDLVDAKINEEGFAQTLSLYPGAQDGVAALQAIADVYVVTSPWSSPTWNHDRRLWLKKHFDIGGDHLIATRAKHVCAGDVLIDDKTSTLERWNECHPRGLPIRWAGPNNYATSYVGITVGNWSETLQLIADYWRVEMGISKSEGRGPQRIWEHK